MRLATERPGSEAEVWIELKVFTINLPQELVNDLSSWGSGN